MGSSTIINGFNHVAGFLGTTVAGHIPKKDFLNGSLNFFAGALPAKGFKTFVIRPLLLVGRTLDYVGKGGGDFPAVRRLVSKANDSKSLIDAVGILTQLPALLKAFTTPISDPQNTNPKSSTTPISDPQNTNAKSSDSASNVTELFERFSQLATWGSSVNATIALADDCGIHLPEPLKDFKNWFFAVATGYTSLCSLVKSAYNYKNAKPAESYFYTIKLAAGAANLCFAGVAFASLYYQGNPPSSLKTWKFATFATTTVLGVAEGIAEGLSPKKDK